MLDHGVIRWVDRQGASGSAIGDVIQILRSVRNNVFHAGKFPEGPVVGQLRVVQPNLALNIRELVCDRQSFFPHFDNLDGVLGGSAHRGNRFELDGKIGLHRAAGLIVSGKSPVHSGDMLHSSSHVVTDLVT